MDYVQLIGSEDVRSAANTIRSAAHEMQSAANNIQWALEQNQRFMENWLSQLQTIISESQS